MRVPVVAAYLSAPGQRLFLIVLVTSLVLMAVLWVATLRFFPLSDPAAVLHYSIDVGIDFIGEGRQIMILPIIGTLMCGFNLVLGIALTRADQRASWILWSIMPILLAILLAAFAVLWRINVA